MTLLIDLDDYIILIQFIINFKTRIVLIQEQQGKKIMD